METNNFILGLDLGNGSLGWALIDFDKGEIIDGGVVLWDIPQDNKASLCAKRRKSRSNRRNLDRKQNRKKHCLKLFKEYDLIPEEAGAEWLQTSKGDKQPFLLRIDALSRILTNRELCQMLYSICSHRGYIDHGNKDADKSSDDGKVLSAIAENEKLFEVYDCTTYSEAQLKSSVTKNNLNGRWRNRDGEYDKCLSKEMLLHDLNEILSSQIKLGNRVIDKEFIERFMEILYWEKIDSSYDDRIYATVGNCTFYLIEKRAARCSFSNEWMSAWERLINIRIKPYEGEEYQLDSETIFKLLDILFSPVHIKGNKPCAVKYSLIRKMLDLPERDVFKGIEKDEEESEVFIPKGFRKLRDCLSERRPDLMVRLASDRGLCDQVLEALTYASHENSIEKWLERNGCLEQLSTEDVEAIKTIPFNSKVFKGYANRSLKALDELIDAVSEGECENLHDAIVFAGLKDYSRNHAEKLGYLPKYDEKIDPTCKNPVVLRCMANVRKLVNAVIKKYGTPAEVHIEVGSELKHSKYEKKKIAARNKGFNQEKEAASQVLSEILGIKPEDVPMSLIRKEILREEQGQVDLLTGEAIDINDLVQNENLFEVDHILPYSRTYDDSKNNKHLVFASTNRNKSNMSPFEFLVKENADDPSWIEFKNRIVSMSKLSGRKKGNLLCENLKDRESDFISRNLNDTRYASRLAKQYIEDSLLFEDDDHIHVFCNAGGVTAKLRYAWGLGTKDRNEDWRHHFVDACLIASCKPGYIQRVAKVHKAIPTLINDDLVSRAKEEYKKALSNTEPWEGFSDDVHKFKNSIYPVRRSSHKVRGKLFEETLYPCYGMSEKKQKAIIQKEPKEKVKGNFRLLDNDKTLQAVGEIAFIRLWWDPKFFKTRGKYLLEVVYKADIVDIMRGVYRPAYVPSQSKHRGMWDLIPERAMTMAPITIFRGDCVSINGRLLRYSKVNIANCKFTFNEMISDKEAGDLETFSKWNPESLPIKVVNEDILGECFRKLEK